MMKAEGKALWIAADEMLSNLLGCEMNKPLGEKQLKKIEELSLGPNSIKSGKKECMLSHLNSVPDFQMLTEVSELSMKMGGWTYSDCFSMCRRIFQGLSKLPALKDLRISIRNSDDLEALDFSGWKGIFTRLESLKIECGDKNLLGVLPEGMNALKNLSIKGNVELEQLLELRAPQLRTLELLSVGGLESISQLTNHFPTLEKIRIGEMSHDLEWETYGNNTCINPKPLSLGKVNESLYFLVVNTLKLGDWSALPRSGIRELKISNAQMDPTILEACQKMKALELSGCILTKEMPPLAAMKELNYLILNDCMLTDFRFARGLEALQIFNISRNGLHISNWPKEELPETLDCLADMPNLLEFVVESDILDQLLERYPQRFSRYKSFGPGGLWLKH